MWQAFLANLMIVQSSLAAAPIESGIVEGQRLATLEKCRLEIRKIDGYRFVGFGFEPTRISACIEFRGKSRCFDYTPSAYWGTLEHRSRGWVAKIRLDLENNRILSAAVVDRRGLRRLFPKESFCSFRDVELEISFVGSKRQMLAS